MRFFKGILMGTMLSTGAFASVPSSQADIHEHETHATCNCKNAGDCTCPRGQCQCKNCGNRHSSKRMFESLKGSTQKTLLPATARNEEARGGVSI